MKKTGTIEEAECPCRYKTSPRSEDLQGNIHNRLNRAIGQLNGVKKMVDDNRYCGDVLTQLAAAEKAIRRIADIVFQEHMRTCVVEQIREGNDDAVEEAMDMMRRFS